MDTRGFRENPIADHLPAKQKNKECDDHQDRDEQLYEVLLSRRPVYCQSITDYGAIHPMPLRLINAGLEIHANEF